MAKSKKERIISLFKKGLSKRAIASKVETTRWYVYQVLKRAKLI